MEYEINLVELSEFYKMFSDSTRLKILRILLNEKLCVNEIADKINMSQSSVSHQLKILRYNNFVKYEKKGKEVYYSLSDSHIKIILKYGIEHINERGNYEKIENN